MTVFFYWWVGEESQLLGFRGARTVGGLSEFSLIAKGEDAETGPREFSVKKITCGSGQTRNLSTKPGNCLQ
jgi:hypothetical protein